MKRFTISCGALALAALLVACGGGGGDREQEEVAPPTPTTGGGTVRYTDKVYSYWASTSGYPELTTLDGKKTRVKNLTQWPDGLGGILNCWAAEKPQPDGTIPQACMSGFSPDRHYDLFIDPSTNELRQYVNPPTDVSWVKLTYDASRIPAAHPDWTAVAPISGGQLFVRQDSTTVLRLLSGDGKESIVFEGDPARDGVCFLVMSYSN